MEGILLGASECSIEGLVEIVGPTDCKGVGSIVGFRLVVGTRERAKEG